MMIIKCYDSFLFPVYSRPLHGCVVWKFTLPQVSTLMSKTVCDVCGITFYFKEEATTLGPVWVSFCFMTSRAMGQSIGDCPELGVKLTAFLTSFFSSLPSEERGGELCLFTFGQYTAIVLHVNHKVWFLSRCDSLIYYYNHWKIT